MDLTGVGPNRDVEAQAAAARLGASPRGELDVFSLGVTGHRSELLGDRADVVSGRIGQALLDIREAVNERSSPDRPQLILVSPLADGADQLAAEAAIALGFELHALLPFTREQTRAEVAEPFRGNFDRLADAASSVIELRSSIDEPLEAYVAAGQETIARSDLLLAIWDGQAPRGRGGTGEVVELAMAGGTPIVHIPVDPARPLALMWNGEGGRGAFDRQRLAELLELLLSIKS